MMATLNLILMRRLASTRATTSTLRSQTYAYIKQEGIRELKGVGSITALVRRS
jgi:hypothetical protein